MKIKTITSISILASTILLSGCNTNVASSYGKPVKFTKNGEVTIYEHWEIPEYVRPNPNKETLDHYLAKYINANTYSDAYVIPPSSSPREIKYFVRNSSLLDEQLNRTPLLSYLFFDSGTVTYRGITPVNRFGNQFNQNTPFHSNSMGKSLVSYITGHAICSGYIDGVDSTLEDWDLLQGTVYGSQKLIDLLNMTAGDEDVVSDITGLKSTGRWYNNYSVASFAKNELRDTKPRTSKKYHYNGLVTNVIMNYTKFKVGDEYEQFLNKIFREKVGIKHHLKIRKNRDGGVFGEDYPWYMFIANPEDYLRIAVTIMNDWQNDTCEGKYLKTLADRSVKKDMRRLSPELRFQATRRYGGQFHLDYKGMSDRNILGLEGYGGQAILIDTTNSRIVVANTIHTDYDWDNLVYRAIKDGQLKGTYGEPRKWEPDVSKDTNPHQIKPQVKKDYFIGPKDGCSDSVFAAMMEEKCE